jgi:hypothetical protein
MAAKKKSARKGAKSVSACKAAGGRPVHFKGMKKGEVVCFTKTSKKKSAAKKGTRKVSKAKKMAGLKKACQTMKKKGFTGKRAGLKAACSAVL